MAEADANCLNQEISAILKLQQYNVMSRPECLKCHNFTLKTRTVGKNRFASYRCKCGDWKSVRDGSFFSLMRTPIVQILLLIKFWSYQLTIAKSVSLFKLITNESITRQMVGVLFKRLRIVCSYHLDKTNIRLGKITT